MGFWRDFCVESLNLCQVCLKLTPNFCDLSATGSPRPSRSRGGPPRHKWQLVCLVSIWWLRSLAGWRGADCVPRIPPWFSDSCEGTWALETWLVCPAFGSAMGFGSFRAKKTCCGGVQCEEASLGHGFATIGSSQHPLPVWTSHGPEAKTRTRAVSQKPFEVRCWILPWVGQRC